MITILEASNYLRGLLVLIRRDGTVSEQERMFVMRVGKSLGFEEGFCTNAIHEIMENTFIDDSQPVFSTEGLAMSFIKDGLSVALSDSHFSESEEQWLRIASERNGVPSRWFYRELANARQDKSKNHVLESEHLVVKH